MQTIQYIGYILDGQHVPVDPTAITDYPTTKPLIELCSFLGLANFFRKSINMIQCDLAMY